jgi:hypothetical protein
LANSGWTVSWPSYLDPYVAVCVDHVNSQAVFIEQFMQYTNPLQNGFLDPMDIVFQQTSASAVPYIAINDLIIVNDTNSPWSQYTLTLLGDVAYDSNKTALNQVGGFSHNPFPVADFSADFRAVHFAGATLPAGPAGQDIFQPGAASGQLWIAAAPVASGPFRAFTISEEPVPSNPDVPEPTTVAMFTLGVSLLRRPRRAA